MAFGIHPFMGIDSLVNRRLMQQRESGLYPDPMEPPVELGPQQPSLPGGMQLGAAQAAPPGRPGFFGRLGQRLTSRRGLSALATGLAASTRARDPGEALFLGLSGGLQGNLAARDYEREQEVADRNYGLADRRVQTEEAQERRLAEGGGSEDTSQMQNYKYLTEVLGVEPEKARFQIWGASGPAEASSNLPEVLRVPEGQWPQYIDRIRQRDAATAGAGGAASAPQLSARDRLLVSEYMEANPNATESDAMLAIATGKFGAPPRITSINTWARDAVGPIYITPDGKLTYTAFDKKTGVKNQPWMVPTERDWGYPMQEGGGAPMPDPGGVR